jgi:hypothetical protein
LLFNNGTSLTQEKLADLPTQVAQLDDAEAIVDERLSLSR